MKKLIFIFAMLIALNLDLLASETITLADTIWMRHTDDIQSVEFHPKSKYIATGTYNSKFQLRVWDVETGKISNTFNGNGDYSVNFSDSGNYLYSGGCIIDCNSWQIIRNHGATTMSSDEQKFVITSMQDNTISLYNFNNDSLIQVVKLDSIFLLDNTGHRPIVTSIRFTKDGQSLIFAGSNNVIYKMDLTKYQITILSTLGGREAIAISNDGKLLAFSSKQENIAVEVMNLETNQIINEFGPNPHAQTISFSPDNKYLAFTLETSIRIFNLDTKNEDYFIYIGGYSCNNISISNSNKYLCFESGVLLLYPTPWSKTSVSDTTTDTTILYPNPTNGNVTLKFNQAQSEITYINLVDLNGNTIKALYSKFLETGNQNIDINVSNITNGSYLLKIINSNQNLTFKLIINK